MSEVTRCSPNTWDNRAVRDCQRQMKIKTGSAGRLDASAGSEVAFWSSARHRGWGQESFLKLSGLGYAGCQAGFTLAIKRLIRGQEVCLMMEEMRWGCLNPAMLCGVPGKRRASSASAPSQAHPHALLSRWMRQPFLDGLQAGLVGFACNR